MCSIFNPWIGKRWRNWRPATPYGLEPVSLTPEELDLEHRNVTRVVPGVPVWAWIRFPGSAELVAEEAFGWATRSVQVTWTVGGVRRVTWFWASAVKRRNDQVRKNSFGREDGAVQ